MSVKREMVQLGGVLPFGCFFVALAGCAGRLFLKTHTLHPAVAQCLPQRQDGPPFEMACGMAVCDRKTESDYHRVFKRAKEAMCRKKPNERKQSCVEHEMKNAQSPRLAKLELHPFH